MSLPPLIIIVAGSSTDAHHCQRLNHAAEQLGLETVIRIASAHKTAEHALAVLRHYEADPRPKVYITVAGRSNALSGFVDGLVLAPVIACPPVNETTPFSPDIWSSLRMPSGIAVAVILEPENAVLFAAKLFASCCPKLRARVQQRQQQQQAQVLAADNACQQTVTN